MGHRIAKHVIDNSTFMLEKSTYYLLDASGNQLALYEQVVNESTTDFNLAERNIYGSTRLGTLYNTPQVATTSYGSIGSRTYELTNHLGNVLAVISDIVYPVSSGGSTINYYQVGINKATDYSPFGVQLDGRNLSGGIDDLGYRYGYQGSERDDEVKGAGNSYTTEFRQLDPRLGRWLSIDPVTHPWQGPYCSMDNNPIKYNDVLGDRVRKRKEKDVERKEFREYKRNIKQLRENSETFEAMYQDMKKAKETFVFMATPGNSGGSTVEEKGRVIMRFGIRTGKYENPSLDDILDIIKQMPTEFIHLSTIAHEAGHAWRDLHSLDPKFPNPVPVEYKPGTAQYTPGYLSKQEFYAKEYARVHEFTEREAVNIENIVVSELINSGNTTFSGMSLRTEYYPKVVANYSTNLQKKNVYYIELKFTESYKVLISPRDLDYYMNNKHNIHEENNVAPLKK